MSISKLNGNTGVVPPSVTSGAAPTSATNSSQPANTVAQPSQPDSSFTAGSSGASTPAPAPKALPVPSSKILPLASADAKQAIAASLDFVAQKAGANGAPSEQFNAKSVMKDDLGMTHVRLDRTVDGVPVFGQQAIAHLDAQGKVMSVTGNTETLTAPPANAPSQVDSSAAIQKASEAFTQATGQAPQGKPVALKIFYAGKDGNLTPAYLVNLKSLSASKPYLMRYFVDAGSGNILRAYNTIDTFDSAATGDGKKKADEAAGVAAQTVSTDAPEVAKAKAKAAVAQSAAASAAGTVKSSKSDPINFDKAVEPYAITPSYDWQQTPIRIDDDAEIKKLTASVNYVAQNQGDIVVKLTSPSGKTVTLKDAGTGGSSDNLTASYDLSKAFKGENLKGDWILSTLINGQADVGTTGILWARLNGVADPKGARGTFTKVASTNPGVDVSATGTTSTVSFADPLKAGALKLNIDMDGIPAAFKVELTSPSGKTITIPTDSDFDSDLRKTIPLSDFAGEDVQGTWQLKVTDLYNGQAGVGRLNGWSLEAANKAPAPEAASEQSDSTSLYSGAVQVQGQKNDDGTYRLKDTTRGGGETFDALQNNGGLGVDFHDANNVWGEQTDDPRQAAAVDAAYGMQSTWDFYQQMLGRNSVDGNGMALNSYVHTGDGLINAFWDGNEMNYGDGGTASIGKFGPLTTIDIAGHEITHGLTQHTAGLEYAGESGGLNEAMSDIMGKGVQWLASQKNPNVHFSWGVGSDCFTPNDPAVDGTALRYMDTPLADGYSIDNYSLFSKLDPQQDNGGVHASSGIANNAFVLMVQGGKNQTSGLTVDKGIGMEEALKIMWRAESAYFTPSTTFQQAADACVQAATDLYGATSPEVTTVKQAWKAVGLNE